jgi:hypothetical protein
MADVPDQLVELRSYTLVPGAAAEFAAYFERHLVVPQEELGMDIVGRFTVPGDDARFVWIRRYLDPAARGEALRSFYGGPVWAELGPRANELMVDHTDVHLLTPDRSAPTFPASASASRGREEGSTVVAALYDLDLGTDLGTDLGADVVPGATLDHDTTAAMTAAAAADAGVTELGRLVTAHVTNDFPRLPVHDDRTVALWLLADHAGGDVATAVAEAVARQQDLALRTIRLTPTPTSPLR